MALNLSSVVKPKSQVLGPFLPTHPENGCSINDAKAIIEYIKQLPQATVNLSIVAESTEGGAVVDLGWLETNCKDPNLPLQLTIKGSIVFPQSVSFGGLPDFVLDMTGLATYYAKALQGNGRPMIESFLSMFGMAPYHLESYYLRLKPVQDIITYTFSKF